MSLASQALLAFQRVATEIKTLRSEFAPETGTTLSSTTQPSSAKPWSALQTKSMILGLINDAAGTTTTDRVWSPNKVASYVAANSGGGTGPFGTLVYCIPASDLTAWPTNGTGAQKMAAITANDARIVHEMVTRPGYHIETDPSQWWPASLVIDEFVGTYTKPDGSTGNLVEGADYSLGGRFLLCRGNRGADTDTGGNFITSGGALAITRKPANAGLVVTPTNLRNFQLGATAANLGQFSTGVVSAFDVTTNLNLYKAGGLLDLVSKDTYGWSARAGYAAGVFKAAFFPIGGLCVTVSSYSLTALSTAVGSTVTTMERRTLVGATSGVTALVQGGDFGPTTGQLVVNSVSGNWTAGEQIKDQATGAVIGTYSSTTVLMRGLLNTSYTDTPQIRFVSQSRVDVGRMMIKPDGDIDDVLEGRNRPEIMSLTGCTNVDLGNIRVLGGYSTGITLRSCYDVKGDPYVRDLPNHAYEGLTERAYGYGLRFLGHCQNVNITVDMARMRHGITSNGIGGTWNLNGRTGSAAGATSLCTNFWNHGPGIRKFCIGGKVENTWSACWDFHEGAEEGVLDHPQAIQPVPSARATTAPDGFSVRGFGITILNAYTDGCRVGVYDLAGPLNSGGLAYENRVVGGVFLRCQAGGYMQAEDVYDESLVRHIFTGNHVSLDPDTRSAQPGQFACLIKRGNTEISGNRFDGGANFIRLGTFVDSNGLGSNATGHVTIVNNVADYTNSTASRFVSVETTYDEVVEDNNHGRINPVAGTQRPANWVVNTSGNSNIRYGRRNFTYLTSTKTNPTTGVTTTGGTPVVTQAPAPSGSSLPTGGTSGQVLQKSSATDGDAAWATPAAPGTTVTVDGVAQTTLDISSTAPVLSVTMLSDAAGPAAGPNVAEVSGLQKTLPVGEYAVRGVVLYQSSTSGGGSIRVGLGGPGAAGASTTGIWIDQNTSASAKSGGVVNALAAGGATAVTAAGTANVSGTGAGAANTTLPFLIEGKLTVTASGVICPIVQLSTGATAVATFKAGSYLTYTKLS